MGLRINECILMVCHTLLSDYEVPSRDYGELVVHEVAGNLQVLQNRTGRERFSLWILYFLLYALFQEVQIYVRLAKRKLLVNSNLYLYN